MVYKDRLVRWEMAPGSNCPFSPFSAPRPYMYSSTCHRGPPLVQGKSDLSWQVTLRDRDRKWHQTHT